MAFRGSGRARHADSHAAGAVDSLAALYIDAARLRLAAPSTGPIPAAASAVVTVTWATPFPDSDYRAVVGVVEGTSGTTATLRAARIVTKTPGGLTVRVDNMDIVQRTGELQAVGVHQ